GRIAGRHTWLWGPKAPCGPPRYGAAVRRFWQNLAARLGRRRGPAAVEAHTGKPVPPHRIAPAARKGRSLVYAPQLDGRADPGEIVWTWVAYEEDPSRGKDRPVLVVGRDGDTLLGLMLSSQDERDGQRNWFALGAGDWDKQHRPSFVRLDRVLTMPDGRIR